MDGHEKHGNYKGQQLNQEGDDSAAELTPAEMLDYANHVRTSLLRCLTYACASTEIRCDCTMLRSSSSSLKPRPGTKLPNGKPSDAALTRTRKIFTDSRMAWSRSATTFCGIDWEDTKSENTCNIHPRAIDSGAHVRCTVCPRGVHAE